MRSRGWKRLHSRIAEMADALRQLSEELERLRTVQPPPPGRGAGRNDNAWRPPLHGAAWKDTTSIGLRHPSRDRNTVPTRERDTYRTGGQHEPHPPSPNPQPGDHDQGPIDKDSRVCATGRTVTLGGGPRETRTTVAGGSPRLSKGKGGGKGGEGKREGTPHHLLQRWAVPSGRGYQPSRLGRRSCLFQGGRESTRGTPPTPPLREAVPSGRGHRPSR